MGSLTALLLVTPIFGFSLHAPLVTHPSAERSSPTVVTYPSAERSSPTVVTYPSAERSSPTVVPALDLSAKTAVKLALSAKSDSDKAEPDADQASSEDAYTHEIKLRNNLAGIHRIFGISTWVAMTLTVIAGGIDYHNLYGFGAGIEDNPCVKGTAAFGDDFGCRGGIRSIKSGLAYITTALYTTTFVLSLLMPDPDDLASGKGEFASTLRLHKTLRWVHFGGMVAQIALGVLVAGRVGSLDRANDYDALQALATVHMGLGLVTLGALSWAGALMTF